MNRGHSRHQGTHTRSLSCGGRAPQVVRPSFGHEAFRPAKMTPSSFFMSYNQMLWMSIADMEAAYPPE